MINVYIQTTFLRGVCVCIVCYALCHMWWMLVDYLECVDDLQHGIVEHHVELGVAIAAQGLARVDGREGGLLEGRQQRLLHIRLHNHTPTQGHRLAVVLHNHRDPQCYRPSWCACAGTYKRGVVVLDGQVQEQRVRCTTLLLLVMPLCPFPLALCLCAAFGGCGVLCVCVDDVNGLVDP